MKTDKKEAMSELINLYQQLEFIENDSSAETVKLFVEDKEKKLVEMLTKGECVCGQN